ncbi:MAG: ATP-binding protein [Caldimonas sp.]
MRPRLISAVLPYGWFALVVVLAALLIAAVLPDRSLDENGQIQVIRSAVAVRSAAATFPGRQEAAPVTLPDDWAVTRPRYEGSVWYRVRFDRPASLPPEALLGLYIERVCSNLEVGLNGRTIYRGGRMAIPVAANCHHPQLVTLPSALLQAGANDIDIRVIGDALPRVTSREFAGGLSVLRVGPIETLAAEFRQRTFWGVTWVQGAAVALAAMGIAMLALAWHNPREVYFAYFGGICLGWVVLSQRLWLPDLPWHPSITEYVFCIGLATIAVLGVQFLLSYAGLRSRMIETALVVQWVLMPISLLVGGEARLFAVANVWYILYSLELLAAAGLYLAVTWRDRRHDFWPMACISAALALLLLLELGSQHNLDAELPISLPLSPLPILMPIFLFIVGSRLFLMFARALSTSEAGRTALGRRVRELTTEFEGNFSQLAELRVEQVTEKERKRIAADLHDDLGAKLLTIVHTSESERISGLAREALEDMRLSVKGLIGKPMRLADALADWRAETVGRLTQSKIEAEWESPSQETEHLLPSHGFVQTTRILREAVSNIIKHSSASRCSVRCRIADGHFAMTIQDNGNGIPMALDGKLDRGLGMSSMKRRAKQMRGQCLVQSGPGYGTVIALTVPL